MPEVNEVMNSRAWNDVQGNMSTATVGASAPSNIDHDFGLGGATFRVQSWGSGDTGTLQVQTNHGQSLNEVLKEHLHFFTTTDGTGSNLRFQIDVVAAPVNSSAVAPVGSPYDVEWTMTENHVGIHGIKSLADIDALNTTVSTLYFIKLTRLVASTNNYTGGVIVAFMDGHARFDQTMGSELEYEK